MAANQGPLGQPSHQAGFSFDPDQLATGLHTAAEIVMDFYAELESRPVSADTPRHELVQAFRGTLGEAGVGVQGALADVRENLLPHAMTIPHPLYLGLINSSPMPGGVVAESIIGAFNNNAGAWQQAPPFVAAEQEALRCFAKLLGLPEDTAGLVLPGGSYSTLHGLQLAREAKLPQWRTHGPASLSGNPRVYLSGDAHFSAARAAIALGTAPDDVVRVPTRNRGEIDPGALAAVLARDRANGCLPFAVVATLGTTGTGAMDSLPELIELCEEHDLWLHVDACYGGAAALLEELAERFRGLDRADSVAIDPHKWFYVPMVAGLIFTRHRELELQTFELEASYIPSGDYPDGYQRGLPTSRRSAGFAIWMSLRAHGLAAIRQAVRHNNVLARRLEQQLQSRGFHVMPAGQLSIVCARWEPEGLSAEELDALQGRIAGDVSGSGKAWFGTVQAQGKRWLRFAFVSTFTSEAHVDFLAKELSRWVTSPDNRESSCAQS